MRARPNEKASPDWGRGGSFSNDRLGETISLRNKRPCPVVQAASIFTARPRGTRWAIAAISSEGEAIKLGIFPRRAIALAAAKIMAGVCGGTWCP